MARSRDDHAEEDRLRAELDAVAPYLALAREIHAEVERLSHDVDGVALARALDAVPDRERSRVAQAAFARLSPERQWDVVEAAFGDDEVRTYLAAERATRLAIAARSAEDQAIARRAREERRLDTHDLPVGHELVLGLFRAADVRSGVERGAESQDCARRLALRATEEPGRLHVLEDVFNPGHDMFVTADYDEAVWGRERLTGHTLVRVGSVTEGGGEARLEPALYLGGRVDLSVDTRVTLGTLHLGFAFIGDEDVFRAPS